MSYWVIHDTKEFILKLKVSLSFNVMIMILNYRNSLVPFFMFPFLYLFSDNNADN